jgi:hypothetical protein
LSILLLFVLVEKALLPSTGLVLFFFPSLHIFTLQQRPLRLRWPIDPYQQHHRATGDEYLPSLQDLDGLLIECKLKFGSRSKKMPKEDQWPEILRLLTWTLCPLAISSSVALVSCS